MADQGKHGISWTDKTWNPIRGCSRVSEGCRNCYAERIAARFSGNGQPYENLAYMVVIANNNGVGVNEARWTGEVRFIEERLNDPLHWKKPCRIFVNSMSDLFHEKVAGDWIDQIIGIMVACPQHVFQILTKRAERMQAFMRHYPAMPNVWMGVSVEDQKTADERIPLLLETPAKVRWVSYEPALGPVDFSKFLPRMMRIDEIPGWALNEGCTEGKTVGLDWAVCGGESGPEARPMHPTWARAVRDQCVTAGVAFHFKQWGEFYGPGNRVGRRAAGRLLDEREWNEYPNLEAR